MRSFHSFTIRFINEDFNFVNVVLAINEVHSGRGAWLEAVFEDYEP